MGAVWCRQTRTGQWRTPAVARFLQRERVDCDSDAGMTRWVEELHVIGGKVVAQVESAGSAEGAEEFRSPTRLRLKVAAGVEEWLFDGGSKMVAARAEQRLAPGGVNVYHTATQRAESALPRNLSKAARMRAGSSSGTRSTRDGRGGARGGKRRGGGDGRAVHDATEAARVMKAPLPAPPWHADFCSATAAAVAADFDERCSNTLEVRRAEGGHVLARCCVNGAAGSVDGWFVLDCSAGGLAIAPWIAEQAGLSALGEIFFHGVQGATASRFRRGTSLSVGPLTLDRPLFLEASLDGALRSGLGDQDRVAGAT
jgi:hypothetical protein